MRCKVCGNWFVGGELEGFEGLCLHCAIRAWAKKHVAEVKAKNIQ